MALLGRDNANDPALSPLLDQLSAESEYHHRLALLAAATAGDHERQRAALSHRSPRIRSFAFVHLRPLDLSPDALLRAFLDGSADDRRRLRRFVNRGSRADLAEAVIDEVRHELGDREGAALLATCGEATVRRLLPEVLYAMTSLGSLARRHPGPLLDHFESTLAGLPSGERDLFWLEVGTALAPLALADPGRVLRLVEEWGPTNVIPYSLQPVLGRLVRAEPARVASLIVKNAHVLGKYWQVNVALGRNARCFAHGDRVAVARALRDVGEILFFQFLKGLAPSDRGRVFEDGLADRDTSNTTWSPANLEVLPHAVRHAEARRILGLGKVRRSDLDRLWYSSFLPFLEARALLEPELSRARAEDRGHGYRLLISSARRERSAKAFSEVLRLTSRLQNEQDPVRLAALQALEAVSAVQITDEHLDGLRVLAMAVVEARDTSAATIHTLENFAYKLLADNAQEPGSPRFQFAVAVLDDLAGLRGSLSLPNLRRLLPAAASTVYVDALLPRLERDAGREKYEMSIALAESLGRRAWDSPGLQGLIERATSATKESVARSAIRLWLADSRTRSERVGRLVAGDESTVVVPAVLDSIARSRQDLLDVVLRSRPLLGRFWKADVQFVPVMSAPFDRWLPRQVEAYRAALDDLVATVGTPARSRTAAVGVLARLPVIGSRAVRPYLNSDDVSLQEAALAGLAWTDQPADALDELLTYAGSDRARVAVYAVSRCARFVVRPELGSPLAGLLESPDAKVTSRKEAARLLGTHRPPGWVEALIDAGMKDGMHRDVRIAVGRALRGALDDDRVWRVFSRLSAGADDEARSLLLTRPSQIPPRHRSRYADLVVAATRSARQQVRSDAFRLLGAWSPWSTEATALAAVKAIEDLAVGGDEWRPAVGALRDMLRNGAGWDDAEALAARLAGRKDDVTFDAGAERDRPSWQRLVAVVDAVTGLPARDRAAHRDRIVGLADRVAEAVTFSVEELTLRFAALDWADAGSVLAAVGGRIDHHPLLAPSVLAALGRALDGDRAMWTESEIGASADHLIDQTSLGTGALAVQLVQAAGMRSGWAPEWRRRLRSLRSHVEGDVATLARSVLTAGE